MTKTKIELIEQYQCPGCISGSNTECGEFTDTNYGCGNHCAGTGTSFGAMWLGLPKGFNRVGLNAQRSIVSAGEKMPGQLRVFENVEAASATTRPDVDQPYDQFNVPVWAMDHDGDLLVRCFSPRIGVHYVDVIGGAKRAEVCPDAIDVAEFIDDID